MQNILETKDLRKYYGTGANQVRALDGVSNTVLAAALRELERDGLVSRTEFLEVPVRVEYAITPKAQEVIPILDALSQWSAVL